MSSSATKSRVPLYLGLAAAGAGGYYLYMAGGDPKLAKGQAKVDAEKAKSRLPSGEQAEQSGEKVGEQAADFEEVVQVAREKTKIDDDNIKQYAKEGIEKIDQVRHDTARSMGTTIDKLDRKVEEKASEAKKGISSWFGGGK
ncbi:hypothetical protein Egran_01612 [Elaphomyces granulatus]|uniref:Calcofluor white hypersensitive protein n=1 Tax=Elaphomyces granulatus TaxID=519963 RepID=A0A232M2Q2_9EURO|nr:hypothetical protein Egran_01612 [Elaphomyces granulatus]